MLESVGSQIRRCVDRAEPARCRLCRAVWRRRRRGAPSEVGVAFSLELDRRPSVASYLWDAVLKLIQQYSYEYE
jgi:hypothetical protein